MNDKNDLQQRIEVLESLLRQFASGGSGGLALLDGGNSFGATLVVGSKDANNVQLITNNIVRATFDTAGKLSLAGGDTLLGTAGNNPTWQFLRPVAPATFTTTDGAVHPIATFDATAITTGTWDLIFTILGINTGATGGTKGDVYQVDFRWKALRINAAAIVGVNATSPTKSNEQPSSGGTYNGSMVVGANSATIDVQGNAGETVQWTVFGQFSQSVAAGATATIT